MADITKKVDRGLPSNERSQYFTDADAGAGDVILIKDSLGKAAQHIHINATAAMSIRINVKRTVIPKRTLADGLADFNLGLDNVALAQTIQVDTMTPVAIGAGETFDLEGDLPVSDIEIVTTAGVYSIFAA